MFTLNGQCDEFLIDLVHIQLEPYDQLAQTYLNPAKLANMSKSPETDSSEPAQYEAFAHTTL